MGDKTILEALKPLGAYKKAGNQIKFNCPICEKSGAQTDKFNLELKITGPANGVAHCWACNYTGGLYKIVKDYGFKEYLHHFKSNKNLIFDNVDEDEKKELVELPKYIYNVLNKPEATKYLLSRGLTKEKIREREVKFCYSENYRDFIIFPSYNEQGSLTGFIAHNPKTKKYYIRKNHDQYICFYENFIDRRTPIILTEGIFDALVMPNAIPLTGLTVSSALLTFLSRTKIILAVDNDVKPKTLRALVKKLTSVCEKISLLTIDPKYKDINEEYLGDKLVLINNLKQFYIEPSAVLG